MRSVVLVQHHDYVNLCESPRLYVNLCKRNYNQSCFDEKPMQESKWTIFGHNMYSFLDEEQYAGTDQLTYSGALFHANSRPDKEFTFKPNHLSVWPYHKRSGSSSNFFHFFLFFSLPIEIFLLLHFCLFLAHWFFSIYGPVFPFSVFAYCTFFSFCFSKESPIEIFLFLHLFSILEQMSLR